jgi:hypothetical protein
LLLFLLLLADEDFLLLLVFLLLLLVFTVPVSLFDLAIAGMVEQKKSAVVRTTKIYIMCRRIIFFSSCAGDAIHRYCICG